MSEDAYLVISLKKIRELKKLAIQNSKRLYKGKIESKTNIVIDFQIEPKEFNAQDGSKQLSIVGSY